MYDFLIHRAFGAAFKLHMVSDPSNTRPHTTFVFVHGIGSSHKMWRKTVQLLRKQKRFDGVSFIAVDLLGFGKSPRPDWATYDAARQARSLHRTIKTTTRGARVVMIGHSLGSLVCIEYAKAYPGTVDSMILCSPPFYRSSEGRFMSKNDLLQKAYQEFADNPDKSQKFLLALKQYALINEGYSIDESNTSIFIKTLKSSIMNQTAYDDALKLTIPTIILSGALDPVLIDANISSLTKNNPYIRRRRIALAAHEITPVYRRELAKTLATEAIRE